MRQLKPILVCPYLGVMRSNVWSYEYILKIDSHLGAFPSSLVSRSNTEMLCRHRPDILADVLHHPALISILPALGPLLHPSFTEEARTDPPVGRTSTCPDL